VSPLLVLTWLALGPACKKPVAPPPAAEAASGALTILHTNDLHGHYLPERADWLEGQPEIGGFVMLDAWVRALRAERGDAVLLLDGGDLLTGTPLTDIVVDGAGGGAMVQLMEEVGYDAAALGNHEFDQGYDNVQAIIDAADFPVLSSNIRAPSGGPAFDGLLPSVVLESNGIKVGVIGATTEGLGSLVSTSMHDKLVIQPVSEAVSAEVQRLDPETDLIVVLSHIGLDADRALAAAVPGIDLIVGGHSHTYLPEPEKVGDTWVVQAGSYTRSIGVLELTVADDAIATFDGRLIDMIPEAAPGAPGEAVVELVEGWQEEIEATYGEVLGEASATLGRDYNDECALGDWITDVLREATGADVAVYNAGGLRADLNAGPLTLRSIFEIFPFGNQVVTFDLTGPEVLSVLMGNAQAQLEGESSYTSISGATLVWRERMGVPEVVEARVGGEPLDLDRSYRVATNSYVAEHARKKLHNTEPKDLKALGRTVMEVAAEAARQGPVQTPEGGRVTRAE
jgi:5'-nucleotidase/UDP-sugar diphosphatase